MKSIDVWLTDEQLAAIYSSAYWNDIKEEQKKDWWIADGNYQRCRDYLDRSGLLQDYREAEKVIAAFPGGSLRIADLAAGIGWTSALLSKLPNIDEVHAVEVSRHRLNGLFQHSVRMMDGNERKLHRHLGSFYDMQFEDGSIDLILLSQAFHHADRPLALLVECDRILKVGGGIILIGEHYMSVKQVVKRFMVKLIRSRKFMMKFHELFPTDHDSGDHYYRVSEYEFMFRTMGYRLEHYVLRKDNMMYVAYKSA